MGLFERYLSVWVGLCIVAGVLLGNILPSLFQAIAQIEYAHVNLVVGVLVEVPVMLTLVAMVNRTSHWFDDDHPDTATISPSQQESLEYEINFSTLVRFFVLGRVGFGRLWALGVLLCKPRIWCPGPGSNRHFLSKTRF